MRCNICDTKMDNFTIHPLTGSIEPCRVCVEASKDTPAPLDSEDADVLDSVYLSDEDLDALLSVSPVE